ncbi:phenazine biosynthesis PhzRF [Teredinibacter turnerae T7901]|uniref:Phenazine biosynthesis PhzRF n=1 Tax=Teredinibacter turnerae (strain ATCC 39867 / T7901) TaxID=377629 RepID=C5BMB6_TERTT|nr:PhzF family phenazine biosynthesis protein [Teredinibacter turnerae]ACR13774.1 phenazine biosynthesis PhzRF [Teredinibacter turnerae T7901]
MEFTVYQVDSFSNRPFAGNPAAVLVLERSLDEETMRNIAAEMNLSETAFAVRDGDRFGLRWFTPTTEVALCGHATLATAHVLFNHLGYSADTLYFDTLSGELRTRKADTGLIEMDFPTATLTPVSATNEIIDAISARPLALMTDGTKLLVELDSARKVCNLNPDMDRLRKLPYMGVCCCALANDYVADPQPDFVSRFFAPASGIPEDPVTGSAHTLLMPHFGNKLGRKTLQARQISARGGDLHLEQKGDRVLIAGTAVTVMKASLYL